MKQRTITVFDDFMGNPHETEAECLRWERENLHMRIVGLTEEQALAAVHYEDTDLAAAIETLARRVKNLRLEAGDVKINRRPAEDKGPPLPPPVGSEEQVQA
jgi:hypothetical protein